MTGGAPMGTRLVAGRGEGQAIAEFALAIPLALLLIIGVFSIGLWVFYQQQLTNIAREAARYAAIHSSTAICPTASWRDPNAPPGSYPLFPNHCDGPAQGWPNMLAHARKSAWGIAAADIHVNACWSGYIPPGYVISDYADFSDSSGFPIADHPPVEGTDTNQFVQCTIAGFDPVAEQASLPCGDTLTTPADDPASDQPGNQVTAYACYQWSPPLAGFLVIPSSVTMRAVVTEVIHRQQ